MTPKEIFEEQIAGRLSDPNHAAQAKQIDSVYQFNVTGDNGGSWVVDLKSCKVESGSREDADCTITIGDQDFINLVEGKVPGFQLWSMGRLQVQGNIGLAMKLSQVLGAG